MVYQRYWPNPISTSKKKYNIITLPLKFYEHIYSTYLYTIYVCTLCKFTHACGTFSLSLSLSPSSPPLLQHNTEVKFSVWDMAGQEVYYATHQCFLSRNTLYLVVWNMEEKEKGIDNLRPWLLNIQVRRLRSALLSSAILIIQTTGPILSYQIHVPYSLAKKGPWAVHLTLGSKRGGGPTFKLSILCTTKRSKRCK